MSIVSTNSSLNKRSVSDHNYWGRPATLVLYNKDLIVEILTFAKAEELQACRRVMRLFQELTEPQASGFLQVKARFGGQIRGPEFWRNRMGVDVENKPLPPDIFAILAAPCPFWPGKMVAETHVLALVPQTVGGKSLNMKLLGELVQKPLQGNATKYQYLYLGQYTDPSGPASHWVLMTRDVLEGTRNQSYAQQQQLVAAAAQKAKALYEVPRVLDATVAIFMEYVATGTHFYSRSPWTLARCQDKYNAELQLTVGGFAPAGLLVFYSHWDHDYVGVAGARTFR